ncbi:MAG: ABC transporter ATP-binding protein, partial [Bacilli bacterium]|nr:ABC transporter ATP-binding protein [Bacilli bacterium]
MLELKNITKSYVVGGKKQQVLKGIDLQFRKCEFTSILGSSGSGKTTLLNIIGGLDHYDDGDLIIEGVSTKKYYDRDWDSYRNYRVGFIFQSYNLIMHQSVLANVEIALTLSGVSKDERRKRAIEALEKVGLKDHVNKQPNQLSGGQMQRVAIARALVNDPEIILADEPTGALDSVTSLQIMDLLKEIAKDKLVIMVTHNPELAKEYSSRIIELKDGVIINDSDPYDQKDEKESVPKKITKTSMSLLSALMLSLNNLLTKKGRTFLTAFAGSIGIIGIALILSLSNGVNQYAKSLEKDSLADYPITIEKESYDIFGSLSAAFSEIDNKNKCGKDELCSKDDIVNNSINSPDKGLLQKNDIKAFLEYFNQDKKIQSNVERIDYKYDFILQVYSKDYEKVNPSEYVSGDKSNLFQEITKDLKDYKLLKGSLPKNKDEIVLIVGSNHTIQDSILYSLNIKNQNDLQKDLLEIRKDNKFKVKSSN